MVKKVKVSKNFNQVISKYLTRILPNDVESLLHIEQSLLVVHDQLIDGSGLLEILNLQKLSTISVFAVVDVY